MEQRQKIAAVEKDLLEMQFELTELESEKNVKTQDAKVQQILKELKGRCRGYYGQLYELVKPINPKYDIAVKVALSKCLRYLVVDSGESARLVNEFLLEKQVSRDVLILENLPDRQFKKGIQAKLEGEQAMLVYDVIEVGRKEPLLEQAVRYFTADKVVARDFDVAVRLQNGKGLRDLVTEDGTEFKQGMISGGQHANVFNLNLGTVQLDKNIVRLVDQTQKLEQEHTRLKQTLSDDFQSKEASLMRQVASLELELEAQRTRKANIERQIQSQGEHAKGLNQGRAEAQGLYKRFTDEIQSLKRQKAELSGEIGAIERDEFKGFCKKAKVKSVAEYEERLYRGASSAAEYNELSAEEINARDIPQTGAGLVQAKLDLEGLVSKCQADLKFSTQQLEI